MFVIGCPQNNAVALRPQDTTRTQQPRAYNSEYTKRRACNPTPACPGLRSGVTLSEAQPPVSFRAERSEVEESAREQAPLQQHGLATDKTLPFCFLYSLSCVLLLPFSEPKCHFPPPRLHTEHTALCHLDRSLDISRDAAERYPHRPGSYARKCNEPCHPGQRAGTSTSPVVNRRTTVCLRPCILAPKPSSILKSRLSTLFDAPLQPKPRTGSQQPSISSERTKPRASSSTPACPGLRSGVILSETKWSRKISSPNKRLHPPPARLYRSPI